MTEEKKPCANCKEIEQPCACMRNICDKCGGPVGNTTFSHCDNCFWDKRTPSKAEELAAKEYPLENARKVMLHDNMGQMSRREALITGYNSRNEEVDQLKERVRVLEKALNEMHNLSQ